MRYFPSHGKTWHAVTLCCSHGVFGSAAKTGFSARFRQWMPSVLSAYPIAFGSYCSPPEYHIWKTFSFSFQSTCGHMTEVFSHVSSAINTGSFCTRVQFIPSSLTASPMRECVRVCPVNHMKYFPSFFTTEERLMSSSHPLSVGERTAFGSDQWIPSRLSV